MNMLKLFSVGDEIYGYCNGYFGRNDYDDKICVMCTPYYAVFEYAEDSSYGATVLTMRDGFTPEYVLPWKDKRAKA